MHVDLWLPHDVVADRMAAALDAGGRLVTDEHAPEFWVLADAEGNEICLCTWQEREGAQTE
jgi:4a-hydroxytetrahydrobiopterin dehydratase